MTSSLSYQWLSLLINLMIFLDIFICGYRHGNLREPQSLTINLPATEVQNPLPKKLTLQKLVLLDDFNTPGAYILERVRYIQNTHLTLFFAWSNRKDTTQMIS